MIDKKEIRLYYFSGTGNTEKVVSKFSDRIKEKDFDITLFKIEENPEVSSDADYILGLAFPVAVFSTYPLVWKFIKALPEVYGREVFMIDTLAGSSGGIVGPLKRVLQKKGYNCIAAKEIVMPSNLNTSKEKQSSFDSIAEKGYVTAVKFADDLIEGNTTWNRVPIISDLASIMSQTKNPWKSMSKMISCGDECVGCGRCVKDCPVDAMHLDNNNVIIDTNVCNVCMRCFRVCKTGALKFNKKPLALL